MISLRSQKFNHPIEEKAKAVKKWKMTRGLYGGELRWRAVASKEQSDGWFLVSLFKKESPEGQWVLSLNMLTEKDVDENDYNLFGVDDDDVFGVGVESYDVWDVWFPDRKQAVEYISRNYPRMYKVMVS